MLLLVYRSCFCQYKKKQSIIKVWKCILKPHIYNIFSIRLLWKVIQHAKFPWIWRSLPINYRIVCTFFFSFYYFMHFYSRQSNFIQNKEQQEEERAEQRKKKVPQMWRNKNKIKSKWNNIQVLFLLFSKHPPVPTFIFWYRAVVHICIYCSSCYHVVLFRFCH